MKQSIKRIKCYHHFIIDMWLGELLCLKVTKFFWSLSLGEANLHRKPSFFFLCMSLLFFYFSSLRVRAFLSKSAAGNWAAVYPSSCTVMDVSKSLGFALVLSLDHRTSRVRCSCSMFTASVWISWDSLGPGSREKNKEKINAGGREYGTWEEAGELQLPGKAWVAIKGKVAEEAEKKGKETGSRMRKACGYGRSWCSYSRRKALTRRRWMGREAKGTKLQKCSEVVCWLYKAGAKLKAHLGAFSIIG